MKIYVLFIAIILPFPIAAYSNDLREAELLNKLKSEIDNNNYAKVMALAKTYEDEYLGDPNFDFLLGIAALETQQVDLSVFAFERVIANRPTWIDAKLYLARAYYLSSNYQSAIMQCESILASNTASNINDIASSLCAQANKKLDQQSTDIKHRLDANIGYDSNINAGTNEERIFLPFLNDFVNLSEESQELSDEYLQLSYQFNSNTALTQSSKLHFTSQINAHSFANETNYNRLTGQMGVDYSKAFKNFNVNIGGHVTPLWFDGNYYRIQSSVLTGIQKSVTKSWRLVSRLMLRKTNNNENELLDTDDYSLKLTSQHFFDNWRFSLSAERLVEDGQVDSNSRTIDSLSLNSFWLLNQQWLTAIDLSFQQHEYEGTHPYYLEEREDDVWLFSSFVQYNLSKTFSYRLNINVQDKNSNLDLFSYNRSEISLSASMNF